MKKVKHERLFLFFSRQKNIEPTNAGRKQFRDHQSLGIKPQNPERYYERLTHGKRMFDLAVQDYKKLYFSGEWWGWHAIVNDWRDNLWVLAYLFQWRKDLNYIVKELTRGN